MSLSYREVRPGPALRSLVDRIWVLEGPAEAIDAGPIAPDGHPEIIVHAGDPFAERGADGRLHVQERVLFAGQTTRAIRLAPQGTARIVGARLHPAGARAFVGVPQHELVNQIAPLVAVHPALARRLRDDVASRQEGSGLAEAFEHVLTAAAPHDPTPSPAARAVALARRRGGLVRVGELAAAVGLSARQLERVFLESVGVPPKLLLRILRFQEVLGALRGQPPRPDWARLAAEHGFYDQAHFIRDFRAFTGVTPSAWQVSDESLTAMFSALRRADLKVRPTY
jgi:AraC-like DNA-binding protein